MSAALASVDKGMTAQEIEAAWFGNLQPTDGFPAGVLADSCGLLDIPVTRVENQCATGNDAMRNAAPWRSEAAWSTSHSCSGPTRRVRHRRRSTFWDWMGMARDKAWDYPLGLIAPASFALHVARFMHEYDVRPEHLAMVAVKNHHNAVTNPMAHLRFEVTVEQVLAAPRVAGPFGVLDCAPQSDGAAAVILVAGSWPTATPTSPCGYADSVSPSIGSCTPTSTT